jgi:hypothetical protein
MSITWPAPLITHIRAGARWKMSRMRSLAACSSRYRRSRSASAWRRPVMSVKVSTAPAVRPPITIG